MLEGEPVVVCANETDPSGRVGERREQGVRAVICCVVVCVDVGDMIGR